MSRPRYKRTGKCLRCGQCCTRLSLWDYRNNLKPEDWEDRIRYLSGFENVVVTKESDDWVTVTVTNMRCRHLAYDCKGRAGCRLHKTAKPKICSDYPRTTQLGICTGGALRNIERKPKRRKIEPRRPRRNSARHRRKR